MLIHHSPLWPDVRRKPAYGAVEIDWTHPLSQGLRAYVPLNESGGNPFDLVTRRPLTLGSAAWTTSPVGRALDVRSGGASHTLGSPITGWPYTLVGSGKRFSDNSFDICVGLGGNAGYVAIVGGYVTRVGMQIRYNGNYREDYGAMYEWNATEGYTQLALVASGQTSHSIYKAGRLIKASTLDAGSDFSGFTGFRIGGSDPGTASASDMFVSWGGAWARALTPDQLLWLSQDPYCFLRPRIRRSYGFVGAAAGGTFKAFWTRRRGSGLLTPGVY